MTPTPHQVAAQMAPKTAYTFEHCLELAKAAPGVSAEQLAGLLAEFGGDVDTARLIVEVQAFRGDLSALTPAAKQALEHLGVIAGARIER
jgi:hypothetical protein